MLKMLVVFMLCTSCTVMSEQHNLYPGLTKPTKLKDIPFLEIKRMSFLEAGWACAKKAGYPKWVHPVIFQMYGCAIVRILHDKVIYCYVIIGSESVLEHELNHCRGYDD